MALAPPIITNGDHAAEALRALFPDRPILPWRDALVEGPVPDLPEEAFRDQRASYLAKAFGHAEPSVKSDFAGRDSTFAELVASGRTISLWFETDLHDQLQLLDILARLAARSAAGPVTLIQVPPPLPSHDLAALDRQAEAVTTADISVAADMWAAVRQETPEALAREALAAGTWSGVRAALRRLLQELPAPRDGLSRIEREILRAVDRGGATPVSAFRVYMSTEELPFLGDAGFFDRLLVLANAYDLIDGVPSTPAFDRAAGRYVEDFLHAPLELTSGGRAVLRGEQDLAVHPRVDRWIGGTHLTPGSIWRWDETQARLMAPA
jgi:hypothetical protein